MFNSFDVHLFLTTRASTEKKDEPKTIHPVEEVCIYLVVMQQSYCNIYMFFNALIPSGDYTT
jgi:hypothetical protein